MKRFVAIVAVLLVGLCSFAAAQKRSYEIEDLLKVRRVGDPNVSPDGKTVAFTIGDVNFDANRVVTQIYTTSLTGSGMKQLTNGDRSSSAPRFSPDGQWVLFSSRRHGLVGIYRVKVDGTHLERLTDDVAYDDQPVVMAPDWRHVAFVSSRSGEADIWLRAGILLLVGLALYALNVAVTRREAQ